MAADDGYERYYTEKLWQMLPELYRTEDGGGTDGDPLRQKDVLRQLIEVIAGQAAVTRRSIDRLWEDQNVETSDDWAVPYIGDLVANRPLSALDTRARRVDVAETIHFRRRRGTPSLLEELVRELSGWDVVLVEAFKRLARACHRLDAFPTAVGRVTRTPVAGTADLRNPRASELSPGPFDEFFHTPDVRRLAGQNGRFNIRKVNFHLFRLQAFVMQGVDPVQLGDPGPVTFTFDPSGRDVPLFSIGTPPEDGALQACGPPWDVLPTPTAVPASADCERHCATVFEWQVTRPIPCRLLGEARFIVDPADVEEALASSTNQATDRSALEAIVGLLFPNETRLRERLIDQGVDFSGLEPPWYRQLLRSAVTSDSGKPNLYPDSVMLTFETQPVIEEDAVTAANLSSRILHPIPSDEGARVLIDPERGRFAPPQPRGPLPPPPPPSHIPPAPDQGPTPPAITGTLPPTPPPTTAPPQPTPSSIEPDSVAPPVPDSPVEPTPPPTTPPPTTPPPTTPPPTTPPPTTPPPTTPPPTTPPPTTPPPTTPPPTTPPPTTPPPTTPPPPVGISDVTLFANGGNLSIGDRRDVVGPNSVGFGTIVNAGSGTTQLGTDVDVGNIWSVGQVTLADRAHVHGFVKTSAAQITQGNQVVIDDPAHTQVGVSPLPLQAVLAPLNFTVAFPAPSGDINLPAGSGVTSLPPGSYGSVTLGSNTTLLLTAGFYFMNTLSVPAGTVLGIDTSGGIVELYISSGLALQGTQQSFGGSLGQFRLIYTGTTAISIDLPSPNPFTGIVLALAAQLTLHQTDLFSGAFFARELFVDPNLRVVQIAWDGVLHAPQVSYPAGGPPFLRRASGSSASAASVAAAPAATSVIRAPAAVRPRTAAGRFARVAAAGDTFTITIPLPEDAELPDVALHADGGTMGIADGARILNPATGFGVVVTAASFATSITGPETDVGNVFGVGDVTLGSEVHVHGFVQTDGTLTNNGATIDDQTPPPGPISLQVALSLEIVFPPTNLGPKSVSTGTLPLDPAAYTDVSATGGVLELRSGKYWLNSLSVSGAGQLSLRADHGPIEIYVRNTLALAAGSQTIAAGDASQIRIAFLGTGTLQLFAPFSGTVMAPTATLQLSNPGGGDDAFVGAFFAQSVDVQSNVTVQVQPFFEAPIPFVNQYVYGFSGPVGAGPDSRNLPVQDPPAPFTGGGPLPDLATAAPLLAIADSRSYTLSIASANPVGSVIVEAGDGDRPYVLVSGDAGPTPTAATLTPAAPSTTAAPNQVQIDGLWLASADDDVGDFVIGRTAATGESSLDWDEIVIRHATFDPGGVRADGTPIVPLRLFITGRVRRLVIARSIVAAIVVQPADTGTPGGLVEELIIVDSIVDATNAAPPGDPHTAIDNIDGKVTLRGVTVFGDVRAGVLDATDTIVDGQLIVANTQESCFRFSAADQPSQDRPLPKLFNAVVDADIDPFFFTSQRFGDPGYAQLSRLAPATIANGAENASQMGAFSFLLDPIHLASIIAKVDEFGPVGMLAQYIFEDEAPAEAGTDTGATT
ncbi:MAG TPA: hypothetical protein VIF57_03505 [Polyangia bacterium]